MKKIKKPSYILLICATFSLTQTATAQNFYKWVDAKGSTHYTTTPPPKSAKKKGQVDTYGWRNSNPTTAAPQQTVPIANTDNQPIVNIPQIPQSAIPAPPPPSVDAPAASSISKGQMVQAPVQYDRNGKIIEQRSPQ